jgi:hypothetical protein
MNKKITFYEFLEMTKEEQYILTISHSEIVNSHVKDTIIFVLYRLYNFYVEVGYDTGSKTVTSITGFLKALPET